jgi:hypothetical protein
MLNDLGYLLPKRQDPKRKSLGAIIESWVHNRSHAIKPHLPKRVIEFFEDLLRRDWSGEENLWERKRFINAEPLPCLVKTEGAGLKRKGMLNEFFDKGSWMRKSCWKGVGDPEDLSFFVVDHVGEIV